MTFEEATREAAKAAHKATNDVMRKYKHGRVKHEDDLTGVLIGALDSALDGQIGGLQWDTAILSHRRGKAAEEKKFGADLLIHVTMNTPTQKYSKGVLVQAKRVEPGVSMSVKDHDDLITQCNRMLDVTPECFVFDYARDGMRCGSATRVVGASQRELHSICSWTSYRFFLELFRCPVGDRNITSAAVDKLPVPNVLVINASGQLSDETR